MSHYMIQPRSIRASQKTKAELREMLAEAVRPDQSAQLRPRQIASKRRPKI
jgi:hypothetical protein